jgi:hypothetical protein
LRDFSEIAINAGEQQPISSGLIKPEHHFMFDMQYTYLHIQQQKQILSDPIADLKEKAKATWALGPYNDIAMFLSSMSAHLVRAASSKMQETCHRGISQSQIPG